MLRLSSGEAENSAFALVDKVIDAVFINGGLGAEPQLFFDFDFDPQALAVETVLVSQVVACHREEALVRVFVGAAPGVVNSHRVIRGDGAVEKTPAFAASVLVTKLPEGLLTLPEVQNGVLAGNKVAVGNGLEHESSLTIGNFRQTQPCDRSTPQGQFDCWE